jgi:hypothetical protein
MGGVHGLNAGLEIIIDIIYSSMAQKENSGTRNQP